MRIAIPPWTPPGAALPVRRKWVVDRAGYSPPTRRPGCLPHDRPHSPIGALVNGAGGHRPRHSLSQELMGLQIETIEHSSAIVVTLTGATDVGARVAAPRRPASSCQ